MSLKDDVPALLQHWEETKPILEHNAQLFDIFEGDLLRYVLIDLKAQLNEKAFIEVSKRVAPINVSVRLVDKLSKIYEKPPVRTIPGVTDPDKDANSKLLSEYEKTLDVNNVMGATDGANGFFNLFKSTWVEPYVHNGKPSLRVIPSDRFFVWSNNRVNPQEPTHFVKIMGKYKKADGKEVTLFYGYTAEEFLIFTQDKEVLQDLMAKHNNPEGKNPYGVLPGVYVNRSKYCLTPKPDSDTLAMTKLIPVCLSDLNYALMYQCFSIIWTIDVDQSKLKSGPNAIWDLKSDATSDKEPKVGAIKPEVDSDKALTMIKAQFSLWMETRNIKAGSMGTLTTENAASGIAKVIDEMDTSGDRKNQVPYFIKAEAALWKLITGPFHAFHSKEKSYVMKGAFSNGIEVQTTFAEQRPILDSSKAIDDQVKKMVARIQSKKGSLKELYPDWGDKQIEEKLKEVEEELGSSPEPGVDVGTTEGAVKVGAPQGEDIQKQALNGAQVTSLVDIVTAVAAKTIPRESGVQMVSMAFQLTPEEAEKLIGPAGKDFKPEQPPQPAGGGFPQRGGGARPPGAAA